MRTLSVFAESSRGLTLVAAGAALAATLVAFLLMASSVGAVPTVTTDKADYHPDETAIISGTGYTSSQLLDVVIIRPDLSIVTGDGTNTPGFDTVTADSSGAFTYAYILNGIFGFYTVNVYDNADTLHTTVLATTTFEDDAGPAECNGGSTDTSQPGSQYVIDGSSTPPVPAGEVVTGICIKSGSNTFGTGAHSILITADGTYGNNSCYTVSGIGTNTVTIDRGATPLCKDISHIDFFTAPPPTTITVDKVCVPTADPGLFNLRIDGVIVGSDIPCGGSTGPVAVSVGTHEVSETAGTGTDLARYTFLIDGDCDGGGNVTVASGENKTCTITNTLNEATFKVTKTFSDGNLAEVSITLTCTSGTITPAGPTTTAGQMVTFTIKGFIHPVTTCTAIESGVPPGYGTDNSDCKDRGISPSAETSCTIINDPATFKVTKTFSDGNLAEVTIELTCDSGTIDPAGPTPTVNQMIIFTITSFTDPGTKCTATESGVPLGYTTDNSDCKNRGISDGAQTSCTITNDPATFTVKKDFSDKPSTDTTTISVTLDCGSATVAAPNPKNSSEASPAVFNVTGFTGDPYCTATELPIPDGYTSTGSCSAPLVATGQCTITNTADPAEFTVYKDFVPDNGATVSVTLSCDYGAITPPNPKDASEGSPAVWTITGISGSANCTASESPVPAGYTAYGCTNPTVLPAGGTASCTITNILDAATLTVAKVCVPSGDPGLFNLRIDANVEKADAACGTDTGPVAVTIGTHTVDETAGSGTNLADYTTVIGGDCDSSGNVTLAAGEHKTCTITNTADGPVGGLVEIAVAGTGAGAGTGAAILGLIVIAIVALLSAGSTAVWVTRRR